MKNYAQAIKEINQSAQFNLNGDDLDNIEWTNGTTPISKSDIEAKNIEQIDKQEAKRKELLAMDEEILMY